MRRWRRRSVMWRWGMRLWSWRAVRRGLLETVVPNTFHVESIYATMESSAGKGAPHNRRRFK